MSLYAGMTLTAKAGAVDRVTKLYVSAATCEFNFFAPPKNPELNPTDREADYTFSGTFDPSQNLYVAVVDTTGWIGGLWHYQAVLAVSPYTAWEYSTFRLNA
jgi:hypothetical protein